MSSARMQGDRGRRDDDPGVPEALPRTLQHIRAETAAERIDGLWIFPPLKNGRRERGLVAVSLFLEEGERRRVVTVSYTAERSGLELRVDPTVSEEGVVRRAGEEHGDPRHVEIEGSEEAYRTLLDEFDPELLDPALLESEAEESEFDASESEGSDSPESEPLEAESRE